MNLSFRMVALFADGVGVKAPKGTTCMMCGGLAERLNRLDNGKRCPSCRDRHLAMAPPVLPGYRLEELAHEAAVEDEPLLQVEPSTLRICRSD